MTTVASSPAPRVAVIDIGKTNAKLALVDLETRTEIAAIRQPNIAVVAGDYPHHDVDALWAFILGGLTSLGRDHRIDAISVTTHGATAVLVDEPGDLALPVLDYEHPIPVATRARYDEVRPGFAESGSPALPLGLNLGAQLYWLLEMHPDRFARARAILTYPQYWSWRLSGVMASEATSLGCHTDLWNPHRRDFSGLVDIMNWRSLFPAVRPANAVLGPILPGIAARTGLDPRTMVINGIHDSNASLLPHLLDRQPPFAVVSTGTWVVAMAVGGTGVMPDPARDTLINVNAFGDPVPSARFMGGREYELLMDGQPGQADASEVMAVLDDETMLLPSIVAGSGPFPGRVSRWVGEEPQGGRRYAAVSFYLAMMSATCLDLSGAKGVAVVEGPLAGNDLYLAMLEAAIGRPVATGPRGSTGTSIGAALLADRRRPADVCAAAVGRQVAANMSRYATRWRSKVAAAAEPDLPSADRTPPPPGP